MKIPIQAVFAVGLLFFSGGICGGGTTSLRFKNVSANPSTFKAAGEKVTLTYIVEGEDYIVFDKGYSFTDDAADAAPICSQVGDNKLNCTTVHTITAEDLALGYVTSHAFVVAYLAPYSDIMYFGRPDEHKDVVTTVVYIENFAPSPTPTITPLASPTPTSTPDPSANAEVIFEKGNTTDLVDCSGTEFAFTVKDPEGVKQVYIEFAVAGFDTDFSKIAATLDLTNSGGDTWSGIFNDTVSTQGQVTYWRVVVVDNNGIKTVYHEDGKFSFYAGNKSCK